MSDIERKKIQRKIDRLEIANDIILGIIEASSLILGLSFTISILGLKALCCGSEDYRDYFAVAGVLLLPHTVLTIIYAVIEYRIYKLSKKIYPWIG